MIASDPLSLIFIFCFLLGFGFFLMTALLGGHTHAHGGSHAAGHVHVHAAAHGSGHAHVAAHGHAAQAANHTAGHAQANQGRAQSQTQQSGFSLFAYLNPTTIGLFLIGFGLFGYFFHNLTDVATSLGLVLAVVSGLVLAGVLLLLLNRLFAGSEGSTEQDVVDRTGMIGKVSITIPERGLGEIIYTSPGGMRKSIAARGLENQRLDRDLEVVVVNYQNGVAEVDTWEHFMHEGSHSFNSSTLDELDQLKTSLDDLDSLEAEMVIHQEQQRE